MMKKIIGFNLIGFKSTRSIGTFSFMKRLFAEMNNQDMSRFRFIVYVQKHLNIDEFLPRNCEVEVIRVPTLKSASCRIIFEQTLFYFYLKHSDVLFSPMLSMPLFGKGKRVLTIHDLIPYAFPGKYSGFRLWYIKAMTQLMIKRVDNIVTVSENSKNDIVKYLNVPENQITVVYNFIPKNEPILETGSLEKKDILDVISNSPFFLLVSTLQPGKNIERLIRAFALFKEKNENYKLIVVGNKGWGYAPILEEAQRIGITNHVLFTGYLTDLELAKLYETCMGVVYVSYYEGFGIPPLEGFYHNKACVVSNTSSLPEVAGEAGICVDPYDELAISEGLSLFLQEKKLLEANISKQILKFDPEKQVIEFLNLLK